MVQHLSVKVSYHNHIFSVLRKPFLFCVTNGVPSSTNLHFAKKQILSSFGFWLPICLKILFYILIHLCPLFINVTNKYLIFPFSVYLCCLVGILSWTMFFWTKTVTVNWQILACARRAYMKAWPRELSVGPRITLPQRSVSTLLSIKTNIVLFKVKGFLQCNHIYIL